MCHEQEVSALDLSWFLPDLAVSGRVRAEVADLLVRRHRIRRVVDLRAEAKDDAAWLLRHELDWLHLPTPDMQPVSQEMLWRGVRWVREGLAAGERVLVHCEYGIARSVLLACCVLVSHGHAPEAAMELAKRARWQASPSPTQLHAFIEWSADWHRACQSECPPVTWEALAAVAYRHLAGDSEGPT